MKKILGILAAVALIAVIIASGAVVLWTVEHAGDETGKIAKVDPPKPPEPDVKEKEKDGPESTQPVTKTGPIVVEPDDPIVPRYEPINHPAALQMLRQEGKTYVSSVVGKVEGTAWKSDWGIQGQANFVYIYSMQSTGKIISNDGLNITEERTFGNVNEQVIVNDGWIGLDLPPYGVTALAAALTALGVEPTTSTIIVGTLSKTKISKGILEILNSALDSPLDINKLAEKATMITRLKGGKLLQGKTVRIDFTDGKGITRITPVNCGLTQEEEDVIKRTNFVMDHYIMPEREVAVGEKWTVDSSVFAGLLDPRMKGRVRGQVTVERVLDAPLKDKYARRVRLSDGNIEFTPPSQTEQVDGSVSNVRGQCTIPSDLGVVTAATITGIAEYKSVSKDHLLFAAKMSVAPKFEVRYECEVKD
ncbi:MAG: hypothetical protein PUC53_02905 [Bacteroidales bacterium]|nr:hypothetical protein [Bacteroidales bacterium]